MEPLVDKETATAEVNKWLDGRKVRAHKREANQDSIDALVEAVMYGQLVVEDDLKLRLKLDHEITGGEKAIEEFSFKPRLTVNEQHSKMKGVKAGDADGRVIGLISALTGKPPAIIGKMDTADYSVAQQIAVFFL